MKYETPKFELLELDVEDIIQTSGELGGGTTDPPNPNETPKLPFSTTSNSNLDTNNI